MDGTEEIGSFYLFGAHNERTLISPFFAKIVSRDFGKCDFVSCMGIFLEERLLKKMLIVWS